MSRVLDADPADASAPPPGAPPTVDVIVPVYDEAHVLAHNIGRLHAHLADSFPFSWRITIVDNGSLDGTWPEAQRLAATLDHTVARHLDLKGRGRALRDGWSHSDAAVVAYMDVDLSTNLDALEPLVTPLVTGRGDLAVGSRLAPHAKVQRGRLREVASRTYNLILRAVLRTKVRDAQCGFKALRAPVAHALLPLVEDESWFFDTELIAVAERSGLRILEIPVDWVDDPDSRVDIARTAAADLAGVWRLVRHRRRATALPTSAPRVDSAPSPDHRAGPASTAVRTTTASNALDHPGPSR